MTRPLTTKEVAKLLRTSEHAVHKLVQSGKLKADRKGRGKRVTYDTQSVAGEMANRRHKGGRQRR